MMNTITVEIPKVFYTGAALFILSILMLVILSLNGALTLSYSLACLVVCFIGALASGMSVSIYER